MTQMISVAALQLLLICAGGAVSGVATTSAADGRSLYIGSITNASILRFGLKGSLIAAAPTPTRCPPSKKRSWQALHPTLPVLYSADGGAAQASAWALPDLKPINQVAIGAGPVLVLALPAAGGGATVLTADYGAGAITVAATDAASGALGSTATINHMGRSRCKRPIDPNDRQKSPHPHGIFVLPSDPSFVFVPDLGLDRLYIYRLQGGALTPNAPQPFAETALCSGPRHLVFSANEKFVVLVHEISNELSVWTWDAEAATLRQVGQPASTLPPNSGWKYCVAANYTASKCTKAAEVRLLPLSEATSAVYASNRGAQSVRLFHLDEATGALAAVAIYDNLKWPRSFAVLPADEAGSNPLVVVACCACGPGDSGQGTAVVFEADAGSGKLTRRSSAPAPNCSAVLLLE